MKRQRMIYVEADCFLGFRLEGCGFGYGALRRDGDGVFVFDSAEDYCDDGYYYRAYNTPDGDGKGSGPYAIQDTVFMLRQLGYGKC